jgi:hypothetical protein
VLLRELARVLNEQRDSLEALTENRQITETASLVWAVSPQVST